MTTSTPRGTVRASQGSQPHFGGLRVGIMRVGEHRGHRKARLWINDAGTHLRVDLVEGESRHLEGHGTLTLESVHLPSSGGLGDVSLSFVTDDA